MNDRQQANPRTQLIWGVALVLMGVTLFFEIPHKVDQYPLLSNSFIQFCLYFIAVALIFGGGKKILKFRKSGDI